MHAAKSGWAGQAFALATSNDSGGRKSRIRRSKEERKTMVESFIKKYQKLNNGNFPSLNLAHKEVGGSFYTVRELVREIIQENRVLAPPKVSSEEHDHSVFLEQHPLGSISIEPQIDLSSSDRIHMATHIMPNKYQITSEENISGSSLHFNGSYPLEVNNEEITKEVGPVADKEEDIDRTSKSHNAPHNESKEDVSNGTEQLPQPNSYEFEDEKIINGYVVLEKNTHSDKPFVTNVGHQDNNGSALLSSQKFDGSGSQSSSNEQYHKENEQIVDKNNEFGQRIYKESAVVEILDGEKYEAQDIEASPAIKSHINSNVVVETFPLRPVPSTIHNLDEQSSNLYEAAKTLDDEAIQHDKMAFVQNSSGFVNEKGKEKLPGSTVKSNREYMDEKVVLNVQGPSLESSNYQSASKLSALDKVDNADSLASGTKASSYMELLISEKSTAIGGRSNDQDSSSLLEGNKIRLDRINLETWEGASKKSTQPESNPFLALVKAFITSFMKFWTE